MAETQEQESRQEEGGREDERSREDEQPSGDEQASGEQEDRSGDEEKQDGSGKDEDANKAHMIAHMKDTHALEIQSIRQLERAVQIAKDSDYQDGYEKHLEQSKEHEQKIKDRIEAHGLKPSAIKDLTMRAGALGTRQLADISPDTPVKLAMHFYALENLEISAYEILVRVAKAANDNETAEAAEQILEQEREMVEHIEGSFDTVTEEMLDREPPEDPEDLPASRGSGEEDEEEDEEEESEGSDEKHSDDETSGEASSDEESSGEDRTGEEESGKEEESSEE